VTLPETGSPTPTETEVDLVVQEQLVAQRAASSDRKDSLIAATRQVVVFVLFVALLWPSPNNAGVMARPCGIRRLRLQPQKRSSPRHRPTVRSVPTLPKPR
jgi:hypothetical protein